MIHTLQPLRLRSSVFVLVALLSCLDGLLLGGNRALGLDDLPTPAELGRWVMSFYRHPEPDQITRRVRQMAELKLLRGNRPEAYEMFLGQVMRANPDKIADWLDELNDLPVVDRAVVHRAAWVSQTDEAKKWLLDHGKVELSRRAPPPIVAGGPMAFEPYHLDQLWEWFFATGDDKPVRRIVDFFQIAPSDPQPGEMPSPPEDTTNRAAMANFRIARPAIISAVSLAIQHDRVLEILKECEKDPMLKDRARAWLLNVIKIAEEKRGKPAPETKPEPKP
ncbi:MAG: hypothetical protein FJ295_06720 [Planctomycetes bacterium]|nr:hypothetical protein [Planctomycetota bacterium]